MRYWRVFVVGVHTLRYDEGIHEGHVNQAQEERLVVLFHVCSWKKNRSQVSHTIGFLIREKITSLNTIALQAELVMRVNPCHIRIICSNNRWTRNTNSIATLQFPHDLFILHPNTCRQKINQLAVSPPNRIKIRNLKHSKQV